MRDTHDARKTPRPCPAPAPEIDRTSDCCSHPTSCALLLPLSILIENTSELGRGLKLADFGSCRGIYSKQPYTEYISTRWYRAPECLLTDGYYGPEMDLWGAGCALATARARVRTPRGT